MFDLSTLTGADIQRIAKGAAESYIHSRRAREEFFDSPDFSRLVGIIKQHKTVDQEMLQYNQVKIQGLSAEDFGRVCNAVFHHYEGQLHQETESDFPTYHIDHEGVRFHLMIGQGSAYWTTLEAAK